LNKREADAEEGEEEDEGEDEDEADDTSDTSERLRIRSFVQCRLKRALARAQRV